MTIQPLHNNILVRVDEPAKQTTGGIYLPDNAHASPPNTATVLATGPGEEACRTELRAGDRIVFKTYKLNLIPNSEDRQVALVDAEDVIGKIIET